MRKKGDSEKKRIIEQTKCHVASIKEYSWSLKSIAISTFYEDLLKHTYMYMFVCSMPNNKGQV